MNILEFVSALEALAPSIEYCVRDKAKLAARFGLDPPPPSRLPDDVQRTWIPDRGIDGYMAQQILSDPLIAEQSFADYAFTAASIFAAEQISVRSGIFSRRLDSEYACFAFRSFEPSLKRIIQAVRYVPLVLDWWPLSEKQKADYMETAARHILLLDQRAPVEQSLHILSISDSESEAHEVRVGLKPNQCLPMVQAKIGLLVMSKFGKASDYILAFDRLKPKFSEQITIMIYDRRAILDQCYLPLTLQNTWRGIAIKHLSYQSDFRQDDYALMVLQASFTYTGESYFIHSTGNINASSSS